MRNGAGLEVFTKVYVACLHSGKTARQHNTEVTIWWTEHV